MIKYESDPKKFRKKALKYIREQVSLDHLNELEQQIALRVMYVSGDLTIIDKLKISSDAIDVGLEVLDDEYELLCDTEVVMAALRNKLLEHDPVCLINKASVISQAKSEKKTRSMIAVDQWKNFLSGSIVVIGNEPTALLRLIEKLEEIEDENKNKKPALIIATPVGFCGAEESKDYLWENHEKLGVSCITVLGTRGGGMMAASIMNTLLDIKRGKKH